jgi:hypothetical protein
MTVISWQGESGEQKRVLADVCNFAVIPHSNTCGSVWSTLVPILYFLSFCWPVLRSVVIFTEICITGILYQDRCGKGKVDCVSGELVKKR